MKIQLLRYNKGVDHTEGLLMINGVFECYTLEDKERPFKVKHSTCIPEGTYDIELRDFGGFDNRYEKRFPDIHKGMLWLKDVPNFKYILIHVGNSIKDTSGCILVGNVANATKTTIANSVPAYKTMYKKVIEAIENKEKVTIEIKSV